MKVPPIFTDQPLFGFDIGHDSIKVLQVELDAKRRHVVTGYGATRFPGEAIVDGVIVDHIAVAKAAHELFKNGIVGKISTKRVAVSLPTSHSFNRTMNFPVMKNKDLLEAINTEASQYIPIPLEDLYIDFDVTQKNEAEKTQEVLVVAEPRLIVDSYVELFDIIGLEPVLFETTIFANSRLVSESEHTTDVPTLIIDFGSMSDDVCVIDSTLRVTGTVKGGGEAFTTAIANSLNVTHRQAHIIKTKYGLGVSKQQLRIKDALEPNLRNLVNEVRKMIRFYTDRSKDNRRIEQIILTGGGANMPGLSDFLTDRLRIPTRLCSPWVHLQFDNIQPPHDIEKTIYVTAAGLALADYKEVLAA